MFLISHSDNIVVLHNEFVFTIIKLLRIFNYSILDYKGGQEFRQLAVIL